MAYFGGYELGKSLVPADSGVLGNMATGAIAQIIAGVVFNPIDILKERMQVQVGCSTYDHRSCPVAQSTRFPAGMSRRCWNLDGWQPNVAVPICAQPMMSGLYSYNSALQALRDLLRKEGGPGLLRGYWVTNSVWIPWNIMYIASYEVM